MERFRNTAALCLSICAVGCASAPTITPPPTCATKTECDVKWGVARTFILNNSRYKFQTLTDDYMVTFSPTGGDTYLGAQVNREPLPNGGWAIVGKFWCDNIFGCNPPAAKTLNEFNAAVSAAHPTH
jgi:hypothetical protein